MKVGDTLICKKKLEYFIDIFTPNEFYSITDIRMNDRYIINNIIFYEYGKVGYIWDYFYTKEELRKLKLESL